MKFSARLSKNLYLIPLITILIAFLVMFSAVMANPIISPAQMTTRVATVTATVTTTSSTATSIFSTTSSITLTTATSVITLSSTIMTYGPGSGGGQGIPGFPWEAISIGLILGVAVLGIARRKHTTS